MEINKSKYFQPSKTWALQRLADFTPAMGEEYSKRRNYDFGPEARNNVSLLSPYIKHRVLSEDQLLKAALSQHTFLECQSFINEVLWRTYHKGYLEMRPKIWQDFVLESASLKISYQNNQAYLTALNGKTGVECFDCWVDELKTQNYLHNHSRMWFAAIWIFSFGLPWQLGADFFKENLIDFCPASNTIGWRWVAGLHTKGKYYFAKEENIIKFTANRFKFEQILNQKTTNEVFVDYIADVNLAKLRNDKFDLAEYSLLVFDEDLNTDLREFTKIKPSNLLIFKTKYDRSQLVQNFQELLLADYIENIELANHEQKSKQECVLFYESKEDLWKILQENKISNLICIEPKVGYNKEPFLELLALLAEKNIKLCLVNRKWDVDLYQYALKGFFNFKDNAYKKLLLY